MWLSSLPERARGSERRTEAKSRAPAGGGAPGGRPGCRVAPEEGAEPTAGLPDAAPGAVRPQGAAHGGGEGGRPRARPAAPLQPLRGGGALGPPGGAGAQEGGGCYWAPCGAEPLSFFRVFRPVFWALLCSLGS